MSELISEKKKFDETWEKEALKAFSRLFSSQQITEFDQALFGDQFDNFRQGMSVMFPDSDDINFKRIRSNRLKLLGYSWQADIKTWIKVSG
ncbi:hypothetical protein [Hahella sp. NBU794]|uniref:hypothetical protein n=1 Tax=Hahella sp. NBU794 TaxID=3422590 RepID=UPI003D6F992E